MTSPKYPRGSFDGAGALYIYFILVKLVILGCLSVALSVSQTVCLGIHTVEIKLPNVGDKLEIEHNHGFIGTVIMFHYDNTVASFF